MKDNDYAKTRRHYRPIQVYCLPEERATIEANAQNSGLSVSSFLRVVGQGYRVVGIVDNDRVIEMARINGDLGRLGGLLKLWLTDDARMRSFGEDHIRALLSKIDSLTDEMRATMKEVLGKKNSNLAGILAAKTRNRDSCDD